MRHTDELFVCILVFLRVCFRFLPNRLCLSVCVWHSLLPALPFLCRCVYLICCTRIFLPLKQQSAWHVLPLHCLSFSNVVYMKIFVLLHFGFFWPLVYFLMQPLAWSAEALHLLQFVFLHPGQQIQCTAAL